MRRLLPCLTLAGALAAPATAAADDVLYRVTATGEGSYELNVDFSQNGDTETTFVQSSFSWETVFPSVLFRDGRFYGVMTPPAAPKITGTISRHIELLSPSAPDRDIVVDCAGGAARDPLGAKGPDMRDTQFAGELIVEPFSGIEFADNKCDGMNPEPFGLFGDEHDPYGALDADDKAFDHGLSLPREIIGSGQIVKLVEPYGEQLLPVECPGYSQQAGERCTTKLKWSGKLTFDRIDGGTTPPVTGGPAPSGPSTPLPPTPVPPNPGPVTTPTGTRIILVSNRAADVRRRGLRLRVTGARAGTAAFTARIKGRNVGTVKLRIGADGRGTGTIRIARGARRLIRPGATVVVAGAAAKVSARLR